MNSLWEQTSTHRDFPRLEQDVKTRVLIIGGGMAGVLCAHLLHQAGIPYVLAEAGRVCGGVTKNTTAKITVQHGLIYHKLVERVGVERAGNISGPRRRRWNSIVSCVRTSTVGLRKKMPTSTPEKTGRK